MKACIATFFFVCMFVLVTGCSQQPESRNAEPVRSASATPVATATPDELAFARANYAKHCVNCHGAEGIGGPAEVDGKKIKVPSFKAEHAMKHSDEDFVAHITDGEEEMPAFKDKLSPDEINQLVRFVRKEFQGK